MAFLSPLTLIGLSLIALPLLIHLLVRRRARRLDFPTLRFLRETQSFRLYPRSLRQPLLLSLRLAAIILFVMGMARPLFDLQASVPGRLRFILLDASLSMKARGRAVAAREQARAIVGKLNQDESACLIAFASTAWTLTDPSADRDVLMQAIAAYQPAGGAADYSAGLSAVAAQLRDEGRTITEVDIVSDFQETGLGKEFAAQEAALKVVAYPVGSDIERNAFLIDEQLKKSAGGLELSATEMLLDGDGRKGVRRSWTIDEREGARPGIEWRTQANGQLTARASVLEPDDFDADDERFYAFSAPREARVLLLEDEKESGPYLGAALEAVGAALDRRRELPARAEELAPYALVVLTAHGAPRADEWKRLFEYAHAGGTIWVWLARDLDPEAWNDFARSPSGQELPFERLLRMSEPASGLGAADVDAPALRSLDQSALESLRAVRVSLGYNVTPRDSAETLVRWNDGGPAFVSSRAGEGEILLLATSTARASSGLGASPAFPALAAGVLRAAVETREPLSLDLGEAVRLNVQPVTKVRMTNMAGQTVEAQARELATRPLSYFREPGIYQLEYAGQQKFLAFNAPAAESERTLAAEERLKRAFNGGAPAGLKPVNESLRREARERNGAAWRYFLAAAFLLLIAELFVAICQRRGEALVGE